MNVTDLLQLLHDADPDATVMLLLYGSSPTDVQEVRSVVLARDRWTCAKGADKGRHYDFRCPGEPHRELRITCEQVTHERFSVVLLAAGEGVLRSLCARQRIATHGHKASKSSQMFGGRDLR
jgi:hypothetical protein